MLTIHLFGTYVATPFKSRRRLEAENLFSVISSTSPWGDDRHVFGWEAVIARCWYG
jgi:hypothetical protein